MVDGCADDGGEALAIHVDADTVYVGGYSESPQGKTPCYWTGVKRIDLPRNEGVPGNGVANAIYVAKNTAYAAGYVAAAERDTACFWTNAARTDLPGDKPAGSESFNTYANSIFVSAGIVYSAGIAQKQVGKDADPIYLPCYWAGNKKVDLPGDGKHKGSAYAVFVAGGSVYSAGFYSNGTREIPCYWTGVKRTDLKGGSDDDAEVYSLFVQ